MYEDYAETKKSANEVGPTTLTQKKSHCLLEQKRSPAGGFHSTKHHNQCRDILLNIKEIKVEGAFMVQAWFKSQAAEYYDEGILKLVKRCEN